MLKLNWLPKLKVYALIMLAMLIVSVAAVAMVIWDLFNGRISWADIKGK